MHGDERDEKQGNRLQSLSQSMMQAIATWAAKLLTDLSYLVATLRNCLIFAKPFSMACLALYRAASNGAGAFRQGWGGMTASAPILAMTFRIGFPSKARSARTQVVCHPQSRVSAYLLSWACPGVIKKFSGLPWASLIMWILVEIPPRDRPSARWQGPLFVLRNAGAP